MKKDEVKTVIRLINFIIDTVAFTLLVFIVVLILKNFFTSFREYSRNNNRILAFSLYFFYYFLFELTLSSTPGKLLTGTKVVDQVSNTRPSLLRILLRTFCRFIPFEGVTVLFTEKKSTLHDIISGTVVINNSAN